MAKPQKYFKIRNMRVSIGESLEIIDQAEKGGMVPLKGNL